jgi:hypothetical protein
MSVGAHLDQYHDRKDGYIKRLEAHRRSLFSQIQRENETQAQQQAQHQALRYIKLT